MTETIRRAWDEALELFRRIPWRSRYAERTKENYIRYARIFISHMTAFGVHPKELKAEHLDEFERYLMDERHWRPYTMVPATGAVNLLIKEVLKVKGESGGWLHWKAPKAKPRRKVPLARREVAEMLNISKAEPRDHAILCTAYFSLLRVSELIHLNVGDVLFEQSKILVREGKGGGDATVDLLAEVGGALRTYLELRGNPKADEPLFLTVTGRRMLDTDVNRAVRKWARRAGVNRQVSIHLFGRHSGITHMIERGVSVRVVQRQSRHKDLDVLLTTYTNPNEDFAASEIRRGLSLAGQLGPVVEGPPPSTKTSEPEQAAKAGDEEAAHLRKQLIQKRLSGQISEEEYAVLRRDLDIVCPVQRT